MAKKFILADQSIISIAGHHCEYALHVLEAAQRAGYDPHLATHVRFSKSSHHSPWKTFALYRYGFWAPQGAPRIASVEWLLGTMGKLRFRWRLFYHFSLFGLLWAVRDRFGEFLLKQPVDRTHLASLLTVVPAAVLLKAARFVLLLLLLPFALLVFLARSAQRLLRAGGFPETYVRSLFADFADLLRFQREVFRRRNQLLNWWQQFKCVRAFRGATEQLLRDTEAAAGDHVFLPTVSAIELMGLSDLLKTRQPGGPTWHVLFRRDIYRGREADYPSQDAQLNDLRQVFLTCQSKLQGHDVRFYTDTDELTEQYNRLGVFRFGTVPIPHTHTPAPQTLSPSQLRIIYVGDARGEKGYQHIPRLVEDLWDDYIVTGRVSFHLQSNFNIPQGEPPAVIARDQLELLANLAPQGLELIKEPLSSDQYREFLLSGDINLLLYDTANYYARSSGILVESLSAGIPVLVPAGSWLSRQFRDAVFEWHSSLSSSMPRLRSYALRDLRWRVHGSPDSIAESSGVVSATKHAKPSTSVLLPDGATHLLVRLRFTPGVTEALLWIDQEDECGNSLAPVHPRLLEPNASGWVSEWIPLKPDARKVVMTIGATEAAATASFSQVIMELISAPGELPRSVIGAVYHDISETPALLRDLIEHYPHYAASAREFAGDWRRWHNSDRLIRELEQVRHRDHAA